MINWKSIRRYYFCINEIYNKYILIPRKVSTTYQNQSYPRNQNMKCKYSHHNMYAIRKRKTATFVHFCCRTWLPILTTIPSISRTYPTLCPHSLSSGSLTATAPFSTALCSHHPPLT